MKLKYWNKDDYRIFRKKPWIIIAISSAIVFISIVIMFCIYFLVWNPSNTKSDYTKEVNSHNAEITIKYDDPEIQLGALRIQASVFLLSDTDIYRDVGDSQVLVNNSWIDLELPYDDDNLQSYDFTQTIYIDQDDDGVDYDEKALLTYSVEDTGKTKDKEFSEPIVTIT